MIRRSASTSTPASTMTRRLPVSSISIRRSVECTVALSDDAATDAAGTPSATTALTKPASDLVPVAAKALRQVTNRERDKPYRRAVAATRRGSDRLSKTIRAFSSSDQRRRRPVSTTSSRFNVLIVWLSIRTVLNHQASPPQGVSPRRLTYAIRSEPLLSNPRRLPRLMDRTACHRFLLQTYPGLGKLTGKRGVDSIMPYNNAAERELRAADVWPPSTALSPPPSSMISTRRLGLPTCWRA